MTSTDPVRPAWPAYPEGPGDGWARGLACGMLQLLVATGAVLSLLLVTRFGHEAAREFIDFGGDTTRGLQRGLLLVETALLMAVLLAVFLSRGATRRSPSVARLPVFSAAFSVAFSGASTAVLVLVAYAIPR